MKKIILVIILFTTFNCRVKTAIKNNKYSIDSRLLHFKITYVSDIDSVLKLPTAVQKSIFDSVFNLTTDTVIYGKTTTYVSCLTLLTGCAEYGGNIAISNDTLNLKVINTNGISCTETNCYRVIYEIDNPTLNQFYIFKP